MIKTTKKEKLNILIVDDDNMFAFDMKDMLEYIGHNVLAIADSGREAIDKAKKLKPDIILMDIGLKGQMDGIEAASEIRSRFDIPSIYITAHEDDEILERAKMTTPLGYVLKPFTERALKIVLMVAFRQLMLEKSLREGEKQLRFILDSLQAGIAVIDADKHRIVDVNLAAVQMLGISREQIIGTDCREYICSSRKCRCPISEHGRSIINSECVLPNSAGRQISVLKTVTPIVMKGRRYLLESFIDNTKRRNVEEKLKESRQLMMNIVNFLPDATFVIDTEGKVIAWNKAIENMTGIVSCDILGKGNYEHAVPFYGKRIPVLCDLALAPHDELEKTHSDIKREGDALIEEAYSSYFKGGRYLWKKASTLYDVKGKVAGAVESIRDISEHKRIERTLRRHKEILQVSEGNMKELSRKILKIREEEKKKLSIDLHDEVGSIIVNIGLKLNAAEANIKNNKIKDAFKSIKETKFLVRNSVKKLKEIESGLRPPHLNTAGLPNVLKDYISDIAKQVNFSIDFDLHGAAREVDEDISLALYRITQEALNNIIKHAKAEIVNIKLHFEKNSVKLQIKDNGKGFNPGLLHKMGEVTLGVIGMRERIEALGGKFVMTAPPEKGTLINIVVPV